MVKLLCKKKNSWESHSTSSHSHAAEGLCSLKASLIDAPAMQGREAGEEVSCTTTVAETWCEHDDRGRRKKGSMWTVLETFSFVFWLNLFKIYDWPHQDSLGSNPPAIPILLLKVAEVGPHASSSRPRPSLWPPALMFFPSTSADRVSFMPGINTLTSLFLT